MIRFTSPSQSNANQSPHTRTLSDPFAASQPHHNSNSSIESNRYEVMEVHHPSSNPPYQESAPLAHTTPARQPDSTASPSLQAMQDILLTHHFANTKSFASMERRIRNHDQDIDKMRHVFSQDLQLLQAKMLDLEVKLNVPKHESGSTQASHTVAQHHIQHPFSLHSLGDAYLAEACDYETAAGKLRLEAPMIHNRGNTGSDPAHAWAPPTQSSNSMHAADSTTMQLLSSAEGSATQNIQEVSTTCCGLSFSGLYQFFAHVESDHVKISAVIDAAKSDNTAKEGTSTDMRPAHHTADSKGAHWRPIYVRNMPPPPSFSADVADHGITFSAAFLHQQFGGIEWSPGFFFAESSPMLSSNSYWLLDAGMEPFIPSQPGEHGAKLTTFFNDGRYWSTNEIPDWENWQCVPVFVKMEGASEYRYFGTYSQHRMSDKVDYDRLADGTIPKAILEAHARELADPGRPQWLTHALKEHFWPKPMYYGSLSVHEEKQTAVSEGISTDIGAEPSNDQASDLMEYGRELQAWAAEADVNVAQLTLEALIKAYMVADAAEQPGLRFWLEYLECEGYDEELYQYLVRALNGEVRCPAAKDKKSRNGAIKGMVSRTGYKKRDKREAARLFRVESDVNGIGEEKSPEGNNNMTHEVLKQKCNTGSSDKEPEETKGNANEPAKNIQPPPVPDKMQKWLEKYSKRPARTAPAEPENYDAENPWAAPQEESTAGVPQGRACAEPYCEINARRG